MKIIGMAYDHSLADAAVTPVSSVSVSILLKSVEHNGGVKTFSCTPVWKLHLNKYLA